jgi:hypothetical protein
VLLLLWSPRRSLPGDSLGVIGPPVPLVAEDVRGLCAWQQSTMTRGAVSSPRFGSAGPHLLVRMIPASFLGCHETVDCAFGGVTNLFVAILCDQPSRIPTSPASEALERVSFALWRLKCLSAPRHRSHQVRV